MLGKARVKPKERKLVATGDPDFPYVYEATQEEMQAITEQFGQG